GLVVVLSFQRCKACRECGPHFVFILLLGFDFSLALALVWIHHRSQGSGRQRGCRNFTQIEIGGLVAVTRYKNGFGVFLTYRHRDSAIDDQHYLIASLTQTRHGILTVLLRLGFGEVMVCQLLGPGGCALKRFAFLVQYLSMKCTICVLGVNY